MAPAECQGTQRMMLSDTNCSLILSGGIIANLQKQSVMRPAVERRGRQRQ